MKNFVKVAKLFGVTPVSTAVEEIVLDQIKITSREKVIIIINENKFLKKLLSEIIADEKCFLNNFVYHTYNSFPEPEELLGFWSSLYSYTELSQTIDEFDFEVFVNFSTLLHSDHKLKKEFKLCHENSYEIENEFMTRFIKSTFG